MPKDERVLNQAKQIYESNSIQENETFRNPSAEKRLSGITDDIVRTIFFNFYYIFLNYFKYFQPDFFIAKETLDYEETLKSSSDKLANVIENNVRIILFSCGYAKKCLFENSLFYAI